MKTRITKGLLTAAIVLGSALFTVALADDPAPPPPGGHGNNGNQLPAPIDGGMALLLITGAAYGGKKIYDMRKQRKEKKT
jgi:hypothetical protein